MALTYLARSRFDALVCLGSNFFIQTMNGDAEILGLAEGECFVSLLAPSHRERVTWMLEEVADSEEGSHAVEICRVHRTNRVLRILATCVGGESSGRGENLHVMLGVEVLADDAIEPEPVEVAEPCVRQPQQRTRATDDLPGLIAAIDARAAVIGNPSQAIAGPEATPHHHQEGRRGPSWFRPAEETPEHRA